MSGLRREIYEIQTSCFRRNESYPKKKSCHQFQEKRHEVPTAVNETPVFFPCTHAND